MTKSSESGTSGSLEMPPEEMRRLGYRVVDEMVRRWMSLREGSAWEGGSRRELEPLMAEDAPERGRDPDLVLDWAVREILPRAGRIDHPRFFAFIPSSPTWPSVLGDALATGFNIFQGTWLESAGPSQLELVVTDWLRSWVGFPQEGGGLLTSGGSVANLCALVAARERAGSPERPVIYLSDQGHSSLERAARIAGIPETGIRKIPTDAAFRMRVDALEEAVEEDRKALRHPLFLVANAGTTNTGAVDPMEALARVAREEEVWFHVDGAYGGFAVLTEPGRDLLRGMEMADSVTLDPHKWFFQPYETGCLLVRDVRLLEDAFRILPEYLQDTALGEAQVNFADRGIQLTRRFRALKIWMSVQMLGLGAFRDAIHEGIRLAARGESYVQASPTLEMLGPASLGILCFRFAPPDAGVEEEDLEDLNQRIQDRIVTSGVAMMSSTRLRETYSLRLAVMNYRSRWEDVLETLEAVERMGLKILEEGRKGRKESRG